MMNVIASRALLFKEAKSRKFRLYQEQIVSNAKILASVLQSKGTRIVSGGTDTHLILLDLRKQGFPGNKLKTPCTP